MRDGLGRVRSVLVYGGDSDIGVAIAEELCSRGAREFLLAGRNLERLEGRAAALRSRGATRVETAAFDADKPDDHQAFINRAFAAFGGIDVAVVAFGVLREQKDVDNDPEAELGIIRTNTFGAASVLLRTAEKMRVQGQGTVILLSSVAAQRPRRSLFTYGASKSGIDALAEGLSFALASEGVQVLTVRPGYVETKMTSGLGRKPLSTTAGVVAKATVTAMVAGKELIWVPWHLRYIMLVMKLIPRFIFRRLKF